MIPVTWQSLTMRLTRRTPPSRPVQGTVRADARAGQRRR
jgi:hypothetical protein